jgi:hypothetical protein
MAGREAARTELVNKRQGAMAEANMNYDNQDAQYAEQARQDRMQSQAARTNFLTEGLTGMSGAYTNDMNNAVGLAATLASVNSPKVLSDMTSALYQTNMSGAAGRMIRGMAGPIDPINRAETVTSNNVEVVPLKRKFNKYGGLLGPIQRKLGGPLSEDPNTPPMSGGFRPTTAAANVMNVVEPQPAQPAERVLTPRERAALNPMTAGRAGQNVLPTARAQAMMASINKNALDRGVPAERVASTPTPAPATSATPANYDSMSFGQAFRAARGANAGTFQWKGKSYTTQVAGASPTPNTRLSGDNMRRIPDGKGGFTATDDAQFIPASRKIAGDNMRRIPDGKGGFTATDDANFIPVKQRIPGDRMRAISDGKGGITATDGFGPGPNLFTSRRSYVDINPETAIINRTRTLPQVVVTGQRANTTSRRAAPTRRSYTNETGRGTISARTRSRRTD